MSHEKAREVALSIKVTPEFVKGLNSLFTPSSRWPLPLPFSTQMSPTSVSGGLAISACAVSILKGQPML